MNFSEKVTELFERTKAGEAALVDRQSRMQIIDGLIEEYIAENGERPEPEDLDRLASLILREELTDSNPHKMTHEEEPIVSTRQQERREGREINVDISFTHGADGKDHRRPVRKITKQVNSRAKSRNAERKRKYNEFTKVQPVCCWNLND